MYTPNDDGAQNIFLTFKALHALQCAQSYLNIVARRLFSSTDKKFSTIIKIFPLLFFHIGDSSFSRLTLAYLSRTCREVSIFGKTCTCRSRAHRSRRLRAVPRICSLSSSPPAAKRISDVMQINEPRALPMCSERTSSGTRLKIETEYEDINRRELLPDFLGTTRNPSRGRRRIRTIRASIIADSSSILRATELRT